MTMDGKNGGDWGQLGVLEASQGMSHFIFILIKLGLHVATHYQCQFFFFFICSHMIINNYILIIYANVKFNF
jgi:hypothetical protein